MRAIQEVRSGQIAGLDQSDLICEAVETWLARKAQQQDLEQQWQVLEHALAQKCKATGVSFARATVGSEAREMRALMKKIKAIDKQLDEEGRRILTMTPVSARGGLALMELGLAIQAPLDCEDHAWMLMRKGADSLRTLLDGA